MATARAIANGNWSSTTTWNGGVLPGNGDTVYANGFNVTINQDINIGGANNPTVNAGSFVAGQWYEVANVGTTSFTTIGAASNTAGTVFLATGVGSGTGTAKALATLTTTNNTSAGAAAGGSFAMSSAYAISTDLRAGTTTCLSVTGATALTLDGLRVIGGSATGAHGCNYAGTTTCTLANGTFTGGGGSANALNNASTGTVNVSASCTFTGGSNAVALYNASTGTVNVSASCTFTGGSNGAFALNNASTGTVNVSASCTFTGGSVAALYNASTGTVNVSASCTFTGGGIGAFAIHNASTGTVIVTQGTFTASAFANAVSATNTSADVRLSGDFLDHWSGWRAVSAPKFRLGTAPTLGQTRYALAGTTDSYFTMFGSDFGTFGNPIASNVRSGTIYGGGNLTGTCAVPAASSVAFGVPVDNTTGTAVLTPAAIRAELATELGRIDATVSSRLAPNGTLATVTTLTNAPDVPTEAEIAAAVWGAATKEITGGVVTTLTNSPDVPTESEIAAQVRTELSVELGRLDAAISTRLAASAYTAPSTPPTAAAIADEVRVELATELARIDAPISGAGNAPSAATVATAVRSELSVELARVDVAISTRSTPANIPTADITAIKAKTDALNTTRLGQCTTTEILGNLLAQANS